MQTRFFKIETLNRTTMMVSLLFSIFLFCSKDLVFAAYDQTGQNCFIAAGLYVVILFFSLWQMRVNDRLQVYVVH